MFHIFVFVALLLCFSMIRAAMKQNIPTHEMNALFDLYDATDGENWNWKENGAKWNFTAEANPCSDNWQGVSCNLVAPSQPRFVVQLSLVRYKMHGRVPESIGNLTKLTSLLLSENRLSGSIPAAIGSLKETTFISLAFNNFTGPVPSSFANLTTISRLELHTNSLNGTLPAFIGGLSHLSSLELYHNQFQGTIPDSWSNLTNLQDLDFNGNGINGTIPASLANMHSLTNFLAYNNALTGSLPPTLCNLQHLRQFVVRTNAFVGPIPSCVGAWRNMTFFDTSDNFLTGTLPAGLSNAAHMELLWAHNNSLRGPIPAEWGQLHRLRELYLHQNRLTGSIPATIGGMTKLAYFYLQDNLLTGTLPPELGVATLILLYLNDNRLTGTIPPQLAQAVNLQEVFLQSNKLRGSLTGLFNRSSHRSLNIVQVSENQLTGTLPEEVAALPRLTTFAASANCFSGTLTEAFCSSKVLNTLILDGLRSASSCRNPLLPVAHSYTLSGTGHGTVPACMFSMPQLETLHLSANGLTGTLPTTLPPSLRLVDLSLSHNALTGSIPAAFQTRYWNNLDLAFNRLSGGLENGFCAYPPITTPVPGVNSSTYVNNTWAGSSFALQNNRLSGKVPPAMVDFLNVSMLGSNMFSCQVDKSDLPQHDGDFFTYECASSSFDYSYYAFLGAVLGVGALLLCALYLPAGCASTAEWLKKWRVDAKTLVTLRHFRYVVAVSDILCQISMLCTALIVLVLVPWYATASHYWGTYTHQYAWVISAAFKSGLAPAMVELVLYIAFVLIIAGSCLYFVVQRDGKLQRSSKRLLIRTSANSTFHVDPNMVSAPRRLGIYCAFLAVNLFAVVGVNVAFVAIALTQSNTVLFLAQILLSVFKLLWNTVCAPKLVRLAAHYISSSYHSTGFVSVQVFVALLNNIAIPCVVVAVVSPSCFTNAFSPPPNVHSSFVFYPTVRPGPDLVHFNGFQAVDRITYKPPFSYSYQCSSSFVTYYAPAFVYLALGAGLVAPALKASLLYLFNVSAPGSLCHRISHALLPPIWKPPPPPPPVLSVPAPMPMLPVTEVRHSLEPLQHSTSMDRSSEDTLPVTPPQHRFLFDANIYIITHITYLGILVTFGVVFPPLAVAMCVTMLSLAWQGKIAVGRFLYNAREAQAQYLLDTIEQECKGAVSMEKLRMGLFIVICYACSFYALFLFDTLGDAIGAMRSFWLLIVLPLLPLLLYALVKLRAYREEAVGTGAGKGRGLGFSLDDTLFELTQVRGKPSAASAAHGASAVVARAEEGKGDEEGEKQQIKQSETMNAMFVMNDAVRFA